MVSIAVVQTKDISCNSANKSYLLQVVHTKAITALTQFGDFLSSGTFKPLYVSLLVCLSFYLQKNVKNCQKLVFRSIYDPVPTVVGALYG